MPATPDPPPARRSNPLVSHIVGHVLATTAEWAVLVPVLVYAYERHGPEAVGIASFTAVSPYVLVAPFTARLSRRRAPGNVRLIGMVVQTLGFALSAIVIAAGGPVWIAVIGLGIGYSAATALRPAAAVILPALVRTSRELTMANVRVGYGDTGSGFAGPAIATVLLGIGGPELALGGAVALTAVAFVVSIPAARSGPPAHDVGGERPRAIRQLLDPLADLAGVMRRPAARAVLLVSMVQAAAVGASDVIWVVIAGDHLDLGDAGAGVLSAMFGIGSFLCSTVSGRAAGRSRVAPLMLLCLALIAASATVLGAAITLVTAFVLVPLIGFGRGLLDVLARVLLQRSAPPSELASLFGALETLFGLGLVIGAVVAQLLIAAAGVTGALVGIGAGFALTALVLARPLRSADDHADVPVVEMTLLRRLALFAPLPTWSLEAVARSARPVQARAGEAVVTEGEPGDAFYAVVEGRYDVTCDGEPMRSLQRGDGFGEIALLAEVPRTATVTAIEPGSLLAIDREPFLVAVTGHEPAHDAAWTVIRRLSGHDRPGS